MKKILIFGCLLVLLIQSSIRTITVAVFEFNREYIALNFCENKAIPGQQCHGQCYLIKKIKKQEAQEKKQEALIKITEDIILFYSTSNFFFLFIKKYLTLVQNTGYLIINYPFQDFDIFHPPQ